MSNSLAKVHPELVSEWSERNFPLTPDNITYGSNKRVWWKGSCGHEWQASVKARSKGEGCPICKESKLEKLVRENLEKDNIEYVKEYSPKWAGKFRYDFFIPSKKIVIECQGYHHYYPVYYSTKEKGLSSFRKMAAPTGIEPVTIP